MPQLKFKVIAPAMRPGPQGVMPDTTPQYMGGQLLPTGKLPPTIGGAIIVGGTEVKGKWYGCTYTTGAFTIPGIGEVEQI